MTLTISEFDRMPPENARELLAECCGSSRWVSMMLERRPFANWEALLRTAGAVWRSLQQKDWREAFARHPRIGEKVGAVGQGERGSGWSAQEQSGLAGSAAGVREEIARLNREYERRFGYTYIVCATDKTAGEMLDILVARLKNQPAEEIGHAAEEQRKITRIRLEKLFGQENPA